MKSTLLNGTQRQVFEKVMAHARSALNGNRPLPILLNVDGTAGTGKSFLIDAVSQALEELREVRSPPHSDNPLVRRIAPTGVAAFNIAGSTYHSALGLGVGQDKDGEDVNEGRLGAMQEEWRGTCYLIIDEKSMVGRVGLARISKALGRIFPDNRDQPFGGLSVLLFGDFNQLPPVGDTPLYNSKKYPNTSLNNKLSNIGRDTYLAFTESVELSSIMRQAGTDPDSMAFKDALSRLRSTQPTLADYELLRTRFWEGLPSTEQEQFRTALQLAGTKRNVNEINSRALARASKPVLRSQATHTGPGAAQMSEDQAQNLLPTTYFMIGAPVMLTRNLWIPQGLVNGARGYIHAIGLSSVEEPHQTVPSVLMVAFPSYTGPTEWYAESGCLLVPITPMVTRWIGPAGQQCTRRQIPLRLAYAITIHKSQGMTLDRAVP